MKTISTLPLCLKSITLVLLFSLPFAGYSQANNLICSATALNSAPSASCTPTAGAIIGATSYTVIAGACGASSGNRNDVWYSFIARSTNPTITLSSVSLTNRSIQVFSGTCLAPSATGFCVTNASTLAVTGLTIGNTYFVRIFSNTNNTGTFSICIIDPAPANDLCTGSTLLTSSTVCTNVAGNMQSSTVTAITLATPACEAGTVVYDVWYHFVAQTPNPTVSLSGIGASFIANARMQLISWSGTACTSSATQLYCGTISINADYLTVGNTYYIRVYSISGTAPANGIDMDFNICVTDPIAPPPFNDNCVNAINLPISSACDNVKGSVAGATLSTAPAPAAPCTGTPTYDVWYKFTAISNSTDIVLSGEQANFPTANSFVQLFSGSCGTLTSLICNGTSILSYATTAGTTYYVRVYSTVAGTAPNVLANFNICVRGNNAPIRFGNSYVNITKQTTGGVVETGDILEIRMTINHKLGTLYNARYVDNVPAGTVMLTGASDRIRIITNEGLTYKQFTLAAGDDAATYLASPPGGQNNIRINLALGGFNPGIPVNNTASEVASATGQIIDTHNPRGGGGVLFAIAYRVQVTAATNSIITLNPGQFIYRTSVGGTDIPLTATPFQIQVKSPVNLCTNSFGVNSAVEFGGTFGNGTVLSRSTDLATPIIGYRYIPNVSPLDAIGDGTYGIVKNISPQNGTLRTADLKPGCSTISPTDLASCENRMFGGHWAVDGDHTGTSNATGNVPPATATNSGYMLVVNADFVASEAYRQTVSNLCPNTYYEFSAWIRNVCTNCGADSLGRQFNVAMPLALQGGYPGVYPNLSFAVDGIDNYSTGEIDPTTGWQKRGFVFRTGPAQTAATFTIRNNSQGGGGNDWAMDDISVSTCLPNMRYSPTNNPIICYGNSLTIADTVRSYFNEYSHHIWQRSTDGGVTWTNVTAAGTSTPVFNGTEYQYIISYTIPPAQTLAANNGDLYRVIVSTTSSNLSNASCTFTDGSAIVTLQTMSCTPVLDVSLLSFTAKAQKNKAILNWTTSAEKIAASFEIEKSIDGANFYRIGTVDGYKNPAASINQYAFTDTSLTKNKTYYRITVLLADGRSIQSKTVLVYYSSEEFYIANLANPFSQQLIFDLVASSGTKAEVSLLTDAGEVVLKKLQPTVAGTNHIVLSDVQQLASGFYILRVYQDGKQLTKKIIRQ